MIVNEEYFDISDMIDEIADNDYVKDFCIIGKYESVKQALSELFTLEDFMPCEIELHDSFWDGYTDEYIVSCDGNDVYCEPVKRNGKYLYFENDYIFAMPDCSKDAINHIKSELPHKVLFKVDFLSEAVSVDDDLDIFRGCADNEILISRNENGKVDGFTKSWKAEQDGDDSSYVFSFYSDNIDVLKKVGEMFNLDLG